MTCMWRSSYIFIFDTSFMVVSIGVYGFWGSVDGDRVIFPRGAVIRVVCVLLCLYM